MRFSTSSSLFSIAVLLSLSSPVLTQNGDPMNDINTLCYVNFVKSNVEAMICIRTGTSTEFTTSSTSYIRNTDEHICCPVGNMCMLSNNTIPAVACYDPVDKRASTSSDSGHCKLSGNSCAWLGGTHGGETTFSTNGVAMITKVEDGKGVIGSGSSSGSSGSSSAATALLAGCFRASITLVGVSILLQF